MAEISNEFLLERLRADFDAVIHHADAPYGLLTITVDAHGLLALRDLIDSEVRP